MTLDDIRRLNFREIGSWPWPIKFAVLAIVLFVILALGAAFDWRDRLSELDQAKEEETKLRQEFVTKKARAINLELYEKRLRDIEESFGALLKQLPNKSEMDALLIDINQAGLGRGLQFELFKPAAQEMFADFYAELPISLKVTGNYHDMGAFTSDIAQLPRIVTLNDVNITTAAKEGLVMEATAKTFRYLDEEEIAKQKKEKAAKEKGQK